MSAAPIGGLPGGRVDSQPQGGRQQVGETQSTRPSSSARIANGALVEGLVTSKNGDIYQVRVGGQTLQARASVPLFIGQRFRAIWDSSLSPPVLRLQQADLAVVSRFSGKDQEIALALLGRGLPIREEVIWGLRQLWMQIAGDPSKLGALVELWARGVAVTSENIDLIMWYMQLTPEQALNFWKKIRKRLKDTGYSKESVLKQATDSDDPEIARFLKAHSFVNRPIRGGIDTSMLLAPAWWPVGGDENLMMARIAVSNGAVADRESWWVVFDVEGAHLGNVNGDVMTNGRALSVNLRLETPLKEQIVREQLPLLYEELQELPLAVQHVGVGVLRKKEVGAGHSVDMEA